MNLRRIALAAGLIIALALVGVWLGRMLQPAPHHGGAELHALIHGELDLDPAQEQELTALERQFAARRAALEDRLRRSNALLGDAIAAEHEYGPRVSAAVDDTHDDMAPYERLIGDAMDGERELFTSEQASELAWRIFDPVLGDRPPPLPYAPGSWGPEAALAALCPPGGWIDPADGGPDPVG